MKILKNTLLFTFLFCLTLNLSQAQNQAYSIHVDYVKPSKVVDYEKISKDFIAACKEYNAPTSWITSTTNDFRYMYITPIDKMADLDENPYADMAKQMGEDFGKIFERFNECYDKHTDFVLTLDKDLTYMPDGISQTQEGQNYRKFIYLYVTPENTGKLKEGMKGIKDLFASKGSESYYRVYRSGFGNLEGYYLVAISAKDEVDYATKSKANDELLGEGRGEVFAKAINYVSRMEEFSGVMRPDLAYSSKKIVTKK
jgi:hypothetical protein